MNLKTRLLRGVKDASRGVLSGGRPQHDPPVWAITQALIDEALAGIPDTLNAPELTYVTAIVYFCDQRPADQRVAKGAILRAPHPEGYVVTQVFLDHKNRPLPQPNGRPYGRRWLVSRIDAELEAAFGGTDCIIVE